MQGNIQDAIQELKDNTFHSIEEIEFVCDSWQKKWNIKRPLVMFNLLLNIFQNNFAACIADESDPYCWNGEDDKHPWWIYKTDPKKKGKKLIYGN